MLSRAISTWGRLLGLGRGPETEEERRAHGRILCDLETTCQPAGRDQGDPVTVRVRNVSRSGAFLLAPHPFRSGELVSVSLPGAADGADAAVLACVVRCDRAADSQWEVGCNFSSMLADADLDRFAPRREPVAPPELRGWVRFVCEAKVAYQVVGAPEPAAWTSAAVVNISGGGVALQVTEPLAVGELLNVELRREGVPVLTALASVVRSAVEPNGERLVGCNFIHELPEDQVAALLG
jgi:hypothetical protein